MSAQELATSRSEQIMTQLKIRMCNPKTATASQITRHVSQKVKVSEALFCAIARGRPLWFGSVGPLDSLRLNPVQSPQLVLRVAESFDDK